MAATAGIIANENTTDVCSKLADDIPLALPKQRRIAFKNLPIQRKLTIGAADDPLEREADAVADTIMRMPEHSFIQRKCSSCEEEDTIHRKPLASFIQKKGTEGGVPASKSVTQKIQASQGTGQSLPASTKSFMESRFDTDFSGVRVHTNASAQQLSKSLNAQAFTVGDDIFFNSGRFSPNTATGKHLLAHELMHTVQQKGNQRISRQQEEGEGEEHVSFWFSVEIDQNTTSESLLLLFVQQYRNVDEQAALDLIESQNWHWTNEAPTISQEDLRLRYKLIRVRDNSIRPISPEEEQEAQTSFEQLRSRERTAINLETNRQFWERTRYREGQPLGNTPDDIRMRAYWLQLRNELIRQRNLVGNLPQEIRDFIFNESGTPLRPNNYLDVLRIARKLMELSEQERQAYLARTNASTDNLNAFESSLDNYITELEERHSAVMERVRAKAELLGLDEVYRYYRRYKSMQSNTTTLSALGAAGNPRAAGTALGSTPTLSNMRNELTRQLNRHNFNSITAFENAIEAFENAFRNEAVFIAYEMLDRYDHLLWTQQERYSSRREVRSLYSGLSTARSHVQQAQNIRDTYASSIVMSPAEMEEQAYWSGQFREQMNLGREALQAQSADHPLFGNSDLPYEELATADRNDVQGVMLSYITDRRNDIHQTRSNIADNPNLIWELDVLLQQAKLEQGIRPDSMYDMIIQDHIRDTNLQRAMINLAIGVFALAAGLVSFGGGTVAVLGASVAFGVGAYQTLDEFRRYEMESAAHGAQLLSEDPTIAWVILGIVGMGLDAAGMASAIRAVRSVSSAARTFNETGDLVQLERSLEQLSDINDTIRSNVMRAARAQQEADEAWRVARATYFGRTRAVIDPLITPLLELAVHFTYPMYKSLQQGIIGLENFLLTRRAVSLIGDFRQLGPEQLANVRRAYQIALNNAQNVAAHGHGLGMLDSEIERFFLLWNRRPSMTAEDMMRQMDQWAEPLTARAGARSRIAPEMILDDASRANLPDFDHRIAGTGGIERITAGATPEGRLAVIIEGEILPQRLARRSEDVTPARRRAPSFNSNRSFLHSRSEVGLNSDWQRLHLWGPGFGDEAAAGMMWGPTSVNQVWQNQSIESYIRNLAELSQRHGGRARVRATAISWENPTPRGWSAPLGEHFLKRVEYDVTLVRPGQSDQSIRVTLDVSEPPNASILDFTIDPPHAINLGDLFP